MKQTQTEYEKNHEAMKKWNEGRAEAERKGLEKFPSLNNDPILHPSKFKNMKQPVKEESTLHTQGELVFEKHDDFSKWMGNLIFHLPKENNTIQQIKTFCCIIKDHPENEANARRIVEAVNNFDEMKSIALNVVAWVQPDNERNKMLLNKAESILSKLNQK